MEKKNKNRKSLLLALVLLLSLSVSVGYAVISSDLQINGTSVVKKNSWKVTITNITNIQTSGATVTKAPAATAADNKVSVDYNVTLNKPGDYYEFQFTVTNGGTLPIKLSKVPTISPSLTTAEQKFFSHAITETNGNAITVASSNIAAGATHTYKVRVEYKDVSAAGDLPSADATKNMNITLNYTQA